MKNRQGIVWAPVLIMVAAVIVAGVAGFYMFQATKPASENKNVAVVNQANSNVNTNIATNTNPVANNNANVNTNTVSNANTAADPTAGWKTYQNKTYNYSIKYPPDYTIADQNKDESVRFDKGQSGAAGYQFLSIGVNLGEPGVEGPNELYEWAKSGFPFDRANSVYQFNPRREKLGLLTFVATDGDTASSAIPMYFVFHNEILYAISSYPRTNQESNRQLIETFQFTN